MKSDASSLDGRHLTESDQRAMRQRVLEARRKGLSVIEIAGMLSMSRSWVYKVMASAKHKGEEAAVKGAKRGPKVETALETRLLTPRQEKALYDWIIDKDPRELQFDGALWTRKAIQEVIKKQFDVEMTPRTVSLYMERWGMTPQNLKKAAAGRDSKEIEEWLQSVYPTIEKKAKKEDALIVWQDGAAIKRHAGPLAHDPMVMEDAGPLMISAINNQGKSFFMFQRKVVNGIHLIQFMNRLILDLGKNKRKLFVICDNDPLHHESIVQKWMAEHQSEIEWFFLPI